MTHPPGAVGVRRRGQVLAGCLAISVFLACGQPIPKQFIRQAEPGVTLTALVSKPAAYRGKTVILGGVIVEQREEPGRIWLLMRNRPLDEHYVPHRDTTMVPSESGYYWVIVDSENLPKNYRDWARVTAVGWVTDRKPPTAKTAAQGRSSGGEPVLDGLYLRGWGYGDQSLDVWEDRQDPNYIQSNPLQELRQ